ncbi:MAG: IS200/IS605 family transposase [Deltaproteobacteria bacterium]|nr:IS200/IS605 family transposase [Deltaproteobacteria bacterium]
MPKRSWVDLVIHAVWSTKDRARVLPASADEWWDEAIRREAGKLRCSVLAVGLTWDHVHLVASLHPTVTLATLIQQIKGASCRAWNQSRLVARPDWRPLVWQDGYWAQSCDPLTVGGLLPYVARQRTAHRDDCPFEAWSTDHEPVR